MRISVADHKMVAWTSRVLGSKSTLLQTFRRSNIHWNVGTVSTITKPTTATYKGFHSPCSAQPRSCPREFSLTSRFTALKIRSQDNKMYFTARYGSSFRRGVRAWVLKVFAKIGRFVVAPIEITMIVLIGKNATFLRNTGDFTFTQRGMAVTA